MASFWTPHQVQTPDEAEWLPPDGAASHAHLNAVAAVRSAATLLVTCRSAPLSRQGPIARQMSTPILMPTLTLTLTLTLTRIHRKADEHPCQHPNLTLQGPWAWAVLHAGAR